MSFHLPRNWSVLTVHFVTRKSQSPSLKVLEDFVFIHKKDNLTGRCEHPKIVLQKLQSISSIGRGANELFLL